MPIWEKETVLLEKTYVDYGVLYYFSEKTYASPPIYHGLWSMVHGLFFAVDCGPSTVDFPQALAPLSPTQSRPRD